MRKLAPYQCMDEVTARLLNEQGIGHNDDSIVVHPSYVLLTMGHTTVKIPMSRFEMFARWYLTQQEVEGDEPPIPNNDTSYRSPLRR